VSCGPADPRSAAAIHGRMTQPAAAGRKTGPSTRAATQIGTLTKNSQCQLSD
jgi:hypothetical protein